MKTALNVTIAALILLNVIAAGFLLLKQGTGEKKPDKTELAAAADYVASSRKYSVEKCEYSESDGKIHIIINSTDTDSVKAQLAEDGLDESRFEISAGGLILQ